MITNADVTIYVRSHDPVSKKQIYNRYVIYDVHWYENFKVSSSAGGLTGGNVFKIRIPEEALMDGNPALAAFLPLQAFRSLPKEQTEGRWTAGPGDCFCLGECDAISQPSDLAKFGNPYGQIRSVGDNRIGGLPHIRIEGW